MKTWMLGWTALTVVGLCGAQAQTEAPVSNYYAPAWRGQAGTMSAFWNDSFTNAYGGSNQAAAVAPGGSAMAQAFVKQTTAGAFLIGSGDIYSYASVNTFVLGCAAAAYPNGVGRVVFQAETLGSELDYGSVALTFETCQGMQMVTAARRELYRATSSTTFGDSSDVVSEWEWPALPVGVTNFTVVFNGAGRSVGLERVMLDVAPGALAAGPFDVEGRPADLARWMYPFNASPANRQTAGVFAAFGSAPEFDTRDGQYLLGWNTAALIPAGQGAGNYVIDHARVTLTVSSDLYYAYAGTLRDYRSYFPTNDPRRVAAASAGSAIELYGAGFRGGLQTGTGFGRLIRR